MTLPVLARNDMRLQLKNYLEPAPNKGFYICPICGSGTGPNKTGALHINRDEVHFKCFSCSFSGDIFDLVGRQYNLDGASRYTKTAELLHTASALHNTTPSKKIIATPASSISVTEYLSQCTAALASEPTAISYLTGRGFSEHCIAHFRLGWDMQRRQVVLPYPFPDTYFIRRSIDGPRRYEKPSVSFAGSEPLFNRTALASADVVFVVESQFCALSILQAGEAAVALGGGGVQRLLAALPALQCPPVFVLCLDNDDAGQQMQHLLAQALEKGGFLHLAAPVLLPYKDPNEVLQSSSVAFIQWVTQTSAAARGLHERPQSAASETCASSMLESLLTRLAAAPVFSSVPTGFSSLDAALHGGLFPGLYIIGALASLGKTTFALQLADQIAQAGRNVLFVSLEMSPDEMLAKSLSRLSVAGQDGGFSSAAVLAGTVPRDQLSAAAERYATFAGHVFYPTFPGVLRLSALRAVLDAHVSLAACPPVLFLDYLQLVAPEHSTASDKQAVDAAVFGLRALARDYRIPVIAVSSLNRENYNNRISLSAFKESGAIEYSSDVLLGLQFRLPPGAAPTPDLVDELKQADVRDVELKILKNRNGRSGCSVAFSYRAATNLFMEDRHAGTFDSPAKKQRRR